MIAPWQQFLRIDAREVEFSRRGFIHANEEIRDRLENIGRIFLHGYHAAFEHRDQSLLAELLNQIELEHRGFAYELSLIHI